MLVQFYLKQRQSKFFGWFWVVELNRKIASGESVLAFTTALGTYTYNADTSFVSASSSGLTPISIQQGSKLAVIGGNVGCGVALAADGNTLATGGCYWGAGGTYVFTRNAGVWTQQGTLLVGSGSVGSPAQGRTVAISADGSTAAVSANKDDSTKKLGAVWIFVR
jgi:hypothetical protein